MTASRGGILYGGKIGGQRRYAPSGTSAGLCQSASAAWVRGKLRLSRSLSIARYMKSRIGATNTSEQKGKEWCHQEEIAQQPVPARACDGVFDRSTRPFGRRGPQSLIAIVLSVITYYTMQDFCDI